MTTLFISDLHLEESRPEIGQQFAELLQGEAREADALYILGDLFESWVGDDDPNPHYAAAKAEIRALTDNGVPVYFMHGNRDFMIGEQFAAETGATLLADPYPIRLHGCDILLSHGDLYCTDDIEYQKIRTMTRNPDWQAMMLAKPLQERLAFAAAARQQSAAHNAQAAENIMDVNDNAVREVIESYSVEVLLHGHTHRPAIHDLELPDRKARRIVLGDWYEQGSMLRWNQEGFELIALSR